MLAAIEKIASYTAGMDYATFAADDLRVDAVLRNLAIIGEAARHIPASITDSWPNISWVDIRAFRNLIVHEYFGVNRTIVWQTLINDLPPLAETLEAMLRIQDDDGS